MKDGLCGAQVIDSQTDLMPSYENEDTFVTIKNLVRQFSKEGEDV